MTGDSSPVSGLGAISAGGRAGGKAKLPVPSGWQAPVLAAIDHLARARGLERIDIAPTRVTPVSWPESEESAAPVRHGLSIWLLARGRTHRYRADLLTGEVAPEGARLR